MTGNDTRYEWPEGKNCAACFSIDVDAESPYLWRMREGVPPLLSELEQRRFGPRQGLHRLTDMLDTFNIKGSFFVPGYVAKAYPWILPMLVDRGHEVGLHGYFHEVPTQCTDADFTEALDRSLDIFAQQVGQVPQGFRSPAWEMTPTMLATIAARGLRYDSSLMGFDHPYSIDGVTELPVQWLADDVVYFRYRGPIDRWPPQAPGPVLEGLMDEFEMTRRYGGLFMTTAHPWISGRGQRIAFWERLLERSQFDDVWWTTANEIAAWHQESDNLARFDVSSDIRESLAAYDEQPRGDSNAS